MRTIPETSPVTIIIPVHNAWDYTAQCLESIQHNTRPPYQVVVVDNGSTDGTGDRLREMAKADWPMQVIGNEENLGFTSAANQGLRATDAEYRVLLNNDTLVCPGWLEGMLFVVGLDGRTGIVGPKVLWPGRDCIMATGGLTFTRSGCFLPIGRGEARGDPRFAGPEDRQYIEGSCMLITRSLIEAIGLLDEVYSPGYWEDADYCFRAREAGFRCVYSPFAEVYHYAGITAHQPEVLAMLRARGAGETEFRRRWSRFFEP